MLVYLFFFQEGDGKWLSLDSELIMRNGEVIGTQTPTGHSVLIDARFELPYGEYTLTDWCLVKSSLSQCCGEGPLRALPATPLSVRFDVVRRVLHV